MPYQRGAAIERIGASERVAVPGVSQEDWELMSEEDRMRLAQPAQPSMDMKSSRFRRRWGKHMNGDLGA
jgi:hypothetical protein